MEINSVLSTAYRGILEQKTHILTKGNEAIIIDAGADIEDIKPFVEGKKVLAVLVTHLHFDHIWFIEEYLKEFGCDVYIVAGAEDKFGSANLNCSYLLRLDMTFSVNKEKIKYLSEKLKIGSFDISVIFTPGHSADSVCYLIEKNLFCGDLVLGGSIGRTDLYDSSDIQMEQSLEKLKYLDFDMAYPGHYEPMSKEQVLKSI